jgi:cyclic-di-GMP-binding protein
MPSFDIVSEVDQVELRNAVDQANKEIANRFDFKGSDARIEQGDKLLTLYADDEFKLGQVYDILTAKFAKRGVDVRCMERGKPDKVSGNKVKEEIKVKVGIESELGKKIVRLIKDAKLKVQATIQGDAVRVTGAKKDLLQEAIALVKKSVTDVPLQYQNFRD